MPALSQLPIVGLTLSLGLPLASQRLPKTTDSTARAAEAAGQSASQIESGIRKQRLNTEALEFIKNNINKCNRVAINGHFKEFIFNYSAFNFTVTQITRNDTEVVLKRDFGPFDLRKLNPNLQIKQIVDDRDRSKVLFLSVFIEYSSGEEAVSMTMSTDPNCQSRVLKALSDAIRDAGGKESAY